MAAKSNKQSKKKNDDKNAKKKKAAEPYGYIPAELCEFIHQKNKEEEPDPNVIDEVQKKKFLRQIAELQQRAERCAKQMDELNFNLTLYPAKFDKIEADTNNISKYLNALLDEKEAECEEKKALQLKLESTENYEKDRRGNVLEDAKNELDTMKNELIPLNQKLKKQLEQLRDVEVSKQNVETIFATYRQELNQKAQKHYAEMYEREKETVRELFEIRELIPTWVKKVSDENKIAEKKRIHKILNNYRIELGDLLKKYIGKPNQLSRKAILENEQLKTVVDKKTLNIKLIEENMEAMKRRGESNVHEMHELASNVKENKILLKSYENDPQISSGTLTELRNQVLEADDLLRKSKYSYERGKKELFEISSELSRLDDANFKLQSIIRNFRDSLHKVLDGQSGYEELLGNLRVASCLDIVDEQTDFFSKQTCCRLVDPYRVFQTSPVVRPETP